MKKTEYDNLSSEAKKVIDYIMDHEHEDFIENPTKTHVYYLALVVTEGKSTANKIYFETIEESLESSEVFSD
jgi:cation transport regulator ChaC